jgi:hypothetical protein
LRSPEAASLWLLRKEWRELITSRSWWVFLLLMGPLVGVSFISAVHTYAEASGWGGTSTGVGEAYSPLIGIWAPTFSACELAAAFLLPFVVIRLVAGDRLSGALKLELQHSMPSFNRISLKALVLVVGWIIATAAPLAGVLLWKSYGGSIYAPELLTVMLGHLLNACLTIALASAAAAVTLHPSTAAIVTLSVTMGSWIVNFIAAVHGGFWERAATYTPTAMVAEFQHGLLRLAVLLVALTLTLAGLSLAAIWTRLGVPVRRRIYESVALGVIAAVAIVACTAVSSSWDLSENRMNSFSRAEEHVLRQIQSPLSIEVHLASEDPRRVDLERRALVKLRRIMPRLNIRYVSATDIGLFEQSNPHYGEIIYTLNGHTATSRATTPEAVLENIFSLAGITSLPEDEADTFRGHPLAVPPRRASTVFYVVWPLIVMACAFITLTRNR